MKPFNLTIMVGLFLLPTFLFCQNFSVSGLVTRHNGSPIFDIEVSCFNTALTNSDGFYEISEIPMNTSCEILLNGDFDKFEDITILDVVRMRQHILSVSNLDLFQMLAADINSTNTITSLDLVKLINLAILKDDGIAPNYEFLSSTNPLTNSLALTVTDNIENLNFTAIKRGDVAISSDHIPAPPEASSPIFTITENEFQMGEIVKIDVNVENFDNIQGVQTTFSWDPNLLEFESISDFQNLQIPLNETFLDIGKLPIAIMVTENNIIGETLIRLNFKALADAPNIDTHVKMTDEIIPRQVVWENPIDNELFIVEGEYVEMEVQPVSVNFLPIGVKSFNVFPNPVEDQLNVNVLLEEKTAFEVSIVNVLGQVVFSKKMETYEMNEKVDVSDLVAGTYFVRLNNLDSLATEIFIKK